MPMTPYKKRALQRQQRRLQEANINSDAVYAVDSTQNQYQVTGSNLTITNLFSRASACLNQSDTAGTGPLNPVFNRGDLHIDVYGNITDSILATRNCLNTNLASSGPGSPTQIGIIVSISLVALGLFACAFRRITASPAPEKLTPAQNLAEKEKLVNSVEMSNSEKNPEKSGGLTM